MQLHVLGPAWSLPSIDADCVAAVALVRLHCDTTSRQWHLIPSHKDRLPALHDNGKWLYGVGAIQRYLDVHEELDPQQVADSIALTALIQVHGRQILDVSHYVSFTNYRLCTRPAFTKILPWYANYILPPRERKAALRRTEHLGVSALDTDDVHGSVLADSRRRNPLGGFSDDFLTSGRSGAARAVDQRQKDEYARTFKLKSLADSLLEPLDVFLGTKDYLLDTKDVSALDCVAYGYLSLVLYPVLEEAYFSRAVRVQYPRLASYTDRLTQRLDLRTDDSVLAALARGESPSCSLPWALAPSSTAGQIVSYMAADFSHRLPLYDQISLLEQRNQAQLAIASLAAILVVAGGYVFGRRGGFAAGEAVQIFGRRRLSDYGAAGALLSGLNVRPPH